jgi:hypothetical protein
MNNDEIFRLAACVVTLPGNLIEHTAGACRLRAAFRQ